MEVKLETTPAERTETDALVIVSLEKEPASLDSDGLIRELYDSGEFSGKSAETALLHRPEGLAARRLLVVGGGSTGKFTTAEMRRAASVAVRALKSKKMQRIALALPAQHATADFAEAAVEGAILGSFDPDQLKTTDKDEHKPIQSFTVVAPGAGSDLQAAIERAQIIAESQNYTRELANLPANLLTPRGLAERARQMCSEAGLECE